MHYTRCCFPSLKYKLLATIHSLLEAFYTRLCSGLGQQKQGNMFNKNTSLWTEGLKIDDLTILRQFAGYINLRIYFSNQLYIFPLANHSIIFGIAKYGSYESGLQNLLTKFTNKMSTCYVAQRDISLAC